MKDIKRLKNFILDIDIYIIIIFVISFFYVVLYHLFLIRIPGTFPYAYEFGKISEVISISLVAAVIFYFFNVHIPEYKRKATEWKFISYELSNITVLIIRLNDLIYKNATLEKGQYFDKVYSETLTKEQLEVCCKTIDPNNTVIMSVEYGDIHFKNWFQLFDYLHSEIKTIRKEISTNFLFYDEELTNILNSINREFDIYLNRFKGNKVNTYNGLQYFLDGLIILNNFRQKINNYKKKVNY
ncbi:hypothetical protein [Alkalihalobacillus sp. BA299]|uniref:hypothetical protein n=1 Tax=Alkalihalobacillus sp. BA299 TaxID=2815938 RepID=UPI001ADAB3BB|nr:hypothetical protein [Alkalihalobacillus sp. BA299]